MQEKEISNIRTRSNTLRNCLNFVHPILRNVFEEFFRLHNEDSGLPDARNWNKKSQKRKRGRRITSSGN